MTQPQMQTPTQPDRPLPLKGIRVLDLGQFIAIPFCTLWLSWLGAEIIVIESRRRMTSRTAPPFAEGLEEDPNASGYFNLLYSGKKSCTVDMTTAAGRDIVRAQVVSQVMVQTLKYTVQRDRPDHSNNKSFPSGHSASAFATATVLHRYYGWKVSGPAYALGSYVALARMSWNRHHATDVVMGAGFGIASARTVTMQMAKSKFNVGVQPQAGGASINCRNHTRPIGTLPPAI
jgi:membrane-associated phospholipid phosphatase